MNCVQLSAISQPIALAASFTAEPHCSLVTVASALGMHKNSKSPAPFSKIPVRSQRNCSFAKWDEGRIYCFGDGNGKCGDEDDSELALETEGELNVEVDGET